MKPFFILIGVFMLSNLVIYLFRGNWDYLLAGKIALSIMLIFTSMGHYMFTNGMTMMIPDFIPLKKQLVYFTGLMEILAAIGIFIPALRMLTGIILIVFFILILPTNIYASIHHLNYETGKFDGKGIQYLWFRVPFQIFLIFWTYYFVIK